MNPNEIYQSQIYKNSFSETISAVQAPTEEINILGDMFSILVDLLIEIGVITEEEYEKRVKQRVKVK
jgi:hypothetical protein